MCLYPVDYNLVAKKAENANKNCADYDQNQNHVSFSIALVILIALHAGD